MDSFSDKVVLITGASSGIGEASALYLAAHGAKLSLTGRNADNLRKVAQQCSSKGLPASKINTVTGDVSSYDDVKRIVDSTVRTFGRLDVLVSNAGILKTGTLEDCDMADYDLVLNTNLKSSVMMAKVALPHLIKTKGNIVMVSSFSGIRPMANCLFYALSKAATDQLVKVLSVELAPQRIRVNGVNPGVVVTDMHYRTGSYTTEKYKQYLEDQKQLVPLGRAGNAEEVASAVAFLASDMASYITGVNMLVDGGRANLTPRDAPKLQSKI